MPLKRGLTCFLLFLFSLIWHPYQLIKTPNSRKNLASNLPWKVYQLTAFDVYSNGKQMLMLGVLANVERGGIVFSDFIRAVRSDVGLYFH